MSAIVIESKNYGPVAKIMHWLTFGLLCVQYAIAWTTKMPAVRSKTPVEGLVGLHLSFGAAILFTVAFRLVWRLTHPAPPPPHHIAYWQALAASATHALLYVLLAILPIMGWASASYRGYRVTLFGLVGLPGLLPKGASIGRPLGDVHVFMAGTLLAAIGLHVVAAL
jgi:cytochrome b561